MILSADDIKIALVNNKDEIIGYQTKDIVHKEGLLHRAFSVIIFNGTGEMLIQQRAFNKYHSPGLWTNTCCSHLVEGMTMDDVVHLRLQQEMGFDTKVEYRYKFTYKKIFDNGLSEYETDHVYTGIWDGIPNINSEEVNDYRWVKTEMLLSDVKHYPKRFTYWFKQILKNNIINL